MMLHQPAVDSYHPNRLATQSWKPPNDGRAQHSMLYSPAMKKQPSRKDRRRTSEWLPTYIAGRGRIRAMRSYTSKCCIRLVLMPPNARLTDGGPPLTPVWPAGAAGPPFGGAHGSALFRAGADTRNVCPSRSCTRISDIPQGRKRTVNRRVGFSDPEKCAFGPFVGAIGLVRPFGRRRWSSGARGGFSARRRGEDRSDRAAPWRMPPRV